MGKLHIDELFGESLVLFEQVTSCGLLDHLFSHFIAHIFYLYVCFALFRKTFEFSDKATEFIFCLSARLLV